MNGLTLATMPEWDARAIRDGCGLRNPPRPEKEPAATPAVTGEDMPSEFRIIGQAPDTLPATPQGSTECAPLREVV